METEKKTNRNIDKQTYIRMTGIKKNTFKVKRKKKMRKKFRMFYKLCIL